MALTKLLNILGGMMLVAACSCRGGTPAETAVTPVPETLSSTLSHPRVTAIAEDSFGHIWVGTAHGLNKDLGYGYRSYFAGEDSLSLHDNHIASLFCDSRKRLWVLTLDGGIYQYTDRDAFASVPMDFHGISHPEIIELPQGTILCNTGRIVFRFDEETRRMRQVIHNTELIIGTFPDPSGALLAVYSDKLRRYDTDRFSLMEEKPLPHEVKTARMAPDGTLWLSGFGSLLRYDPHDGTFAEGPQALKTEIEKGRLTDILPGDGGSLLFNTRNSLVRYNPGPGSVTVSSDSPTSPYYTADYDINCAFSDSRGNLWMGLNGGGVLRVDHGRTHAGLHPLLDFFDGMFISALEYADGSLSITAGKNRRFLYSLASGTLKELPVNLSARPDGAPWPEYGKNFHLSLPGGKTLDTGYDKDLHVSSPQGSFTIPLGELTATLGSQHFVPEVLFEDSRHTLWIGTQSDGVLFLPEGRSSAQRVQRISCGEISSILEDLSGHIWIGTQYGLNEFSPEGELLNIYTAGNGIAGNAFTEGAACRLPDGVLLFGTMQGLVARFFSEETSPEKVPLLLEELKVQNLPVQPGAGAPIVKSMNYAPPVSLSHRQNSFSISYAALDYGKAARAGFEYKLDGLDSFWVEAGDSHEAFYSNVPAGQYTFMVRLTQADHTPVSETVSVPIRVCPAPWASWWARLLYFLAAAALLFGVFYTWLRHLRRQEEARRIAQEKEQERRMGEINKQYFANVAHQLRTPLTMISGPVGTLSESDDIKGSSKTLLRIVRHNTDRMLHLVNQIMDFNALETDALALKVRRVDICPILRDTLDIYQVNAEEKGIHFLSDGMEGNAFVFADADKIVNILDNLLSNAVKYTPSGGVISVSLTEMASQAVLKVSNSGPTIPEDKLDRIFERYYQIDGVTQHGRYNWGSGVGLYYAGKLAQMHHGTLICTNAEDGNGVCFTLSFPTARESFRPEEMETGATAEVLQDTTHAFPEGTPLTEEADAALLPAALVVDDDTDITFYLRTLLSPHYRVTCCYDVESAREELSQHIPDIILSDVMMNGQTGLDFCAFLKGELQYCHIPVVILTAKDNIRDQIDGLNAGADAYVIKPFHAEYLISLIENLLKGRRRLREALSENAGLDLPGDSSLSPQDRTFLKELYALMDEELSNSEFNIGDIVDKLHISHSKFLYKVKGLTGTTPSELFKNYKLNKAAAMLREGKYNISEVSDLTGFSSLAHFSKVFKKKFGVPPSEFK